MKSNKLKKRAREIQAKTDWSYSECRRLAIEGLSDEGLAMLIQIRSTPERHS